MDYKTKRIEELREKFMEYQTVCFDCGHQIDFHYWTGIPSSEKVIDRCKHKDCKCLNESNKTKDIPYSESIRVLEAFLSETIDEVEKQVRKNLRLTILDLYTNGVIDGNIYKKIQLKITSQSG